jgi:hypothetical protein
VASTGVIVLRFVGPTRTWAAVVASRDISDERKLESKLLEAQKLDSIGKLAGGVVHDFNNLLTSFCGLITAAPRALPTDSTAHEYLSLMQLTFTIPDDAEAGTYVAAAKAR